MPEDSHITRKCFCEEWRTKHRKCMYCVKMEFAENFYLTSRIIEEQTFIDENLNGDVKE